MLLNISSIWIVALKRAFMSMNLSLNSFWLSMQKGQNLSQLLLGP